MTRTLLMERVLDETRLAVIEENRLAELHIQRPDSENVTGNLYLGRVENVLPGMNAAFIDIGIGKSGFIAADDLGAPMVADRALAEELGRKRIEQLARPGQPILVQAIKSQPGGKGPRLSAHVTLPGRLMALLTDVAHIGVSRKIEDADERERLRGIGMRLLAEGGCGLILRTAASGAQEDAIRDEYRRLTAAWRQIQTCAAHGIAPKCLHDDNALALRAVRDWLNADTDALWVDDPTLFEEARAIAAAIAPEQAGKVCLHEGEMPLFDLYRVDSQAEKALQKFVWLKGGGSLVIEQTEALTVVDVNTARNVGKGSAEETVLNNNLEAAREMMRQLRLRDIGGIVVVDFIDMKKEADRQALLDALRACARQDRVRVDVVGITALGLVELTRKKARQSLSRQLMHTCSACGGNGTVPSHETVARRALREIWRRRRAGEANPMLLEAAPEVCGRLRAIGYPAGGAVYVHANADLAAGEYRLSPADENRLPDGAKPLKRG